MQVPGLPSQFFLVYLLLLLPWMGFKSSRNARRSQASGVAYTDSELERIWFATLLNLSMMLALAWTVGDSFGFQICATPAWNGRVVWASVAALAVCLLMRVIVRRFHAADERRKMVVFALAARTRRQWFLKSLTIVLASVAEEAAYRGIGWAILNYVLGSPLAAAVICSVAFALAHWMQGWTSMLVILLIAGLMHALVWYTRSLVPAMLVHGAYDFIAMTLIGREAARQRADGGELRG